MRPVISFPAVAILFFLPLFSRMARAEDALIPPIRHDDAFDVARGGHIFDYSEIDPGFNIEDLIGAELSGGEPTRVLFFDFGPTTKPLPPGYVDYWVVETPEDVPLTGVRLILIHDLYAGDYMLQTKAYDNLGGYGMSPPVTIHVRAPAAEIRLSNPQMREEGFAFVASGLTPGARHTVFRSTDLLQWSSWGDFSASGESVEYVDPSPGTVRFYRIVQVSE